MSILRITDRTTTVDLLWHSAANRTAIQPRGTGAPGIAGRKRGQVGGGDPYTDVVEERVVHFLGESVGEVLANQARVLRLLMQAQDWDDGVPGTAPVFLQLQVQTGDVLEAALLGPAVADESGMALGATFNNDVRAYMSQGVRLRYRRRGAWLAPLEAGVSSSSTAIGSVWTITLPDSHLTISPIRLTWTAPNSARTPAIGPLIVAASASDISVLEGETIGAGGAYTVVSPLASTVARGGQVLRATGAAGFRALSYANIPSVLKSGPGVVDIWCVGLAYGDPTLDVFSIFWEYTSPGAGDSAVPPQTTAPVTVLGQDSYIRPFFCGTIDVPESGIETLGISVAGSQTTSIIDLDYFVFVARKPTTFISYPSVAAATNVFGSGNTMRALIDAAQHTYPDPLAAVERTSGGSTRSAIANAGDQWVGCKGSTIAGIWLAVEGTSAFRYPSTAGGSTVLSSTFTAERRKAFLLPE